MYYLNIEIDRTRRLRFDHNAMADVEVQMALGIQELLSRNMSFAFLRVMMWSTAKWEDVRLTIEGAGDLVEKYCSPKEQGGCGHDVDELADLMIDACRQAGVLKALVKDPDAGALEDLSRPPEVATKPSPPGEPDDKPHSTSSAVMPTKEAEALATT